MNTALGAVEPKRGADHPSAAEYGFWAFLLIAIGRVNQLIPGLSSLPLAKLAILFPCVALLINRHPLQPLSRDGRSLMKTGLGIVALAVLLTPISFWPGSSRHFLVFDLPPMIAATAIACAMRRSWSSLRGTLLVLLLSGFILGGMAILHHSGGRAYDSRTDLDPNDLAYILVTVIPIGVAFVLISKSWKLKIFHGAVTAIATLALLLTESRGGLLGFLTVIALLIFVPIGVGGQDEDRYVRGFRASFVVAAVLACAAVVVWTQLPESAQARYMTLLHLNKDYNTNLQDRTGREDIWLQGLTAFVHRPIGYGPRTFQMVDMRFGGQFKAPHNSYLQALVELGPLGLFFFVRMYLLALRALQRTRSGMLERKKPSPDCLERAVLARALQFGLLGNMVSAFFLSDAYAMLPWVISGLSAAIAALPEPREMHTTRMSRQLNAPSARGAGSRRADSERDLAKGSRARAKSPLGR